ncbi:MAG TPA: anthranilate synthase component I family protein [Thermoanaerobaculia bacterium]|jgi:para-aminobenzoate synthetase component 1|nr:anthranilate synthase component I family protein [Thermoanaerobaculia bacterium]
MWSDRPSESVRARRIERLRALLPPPREGTRGSKTPLRGTPSPEQVAEELRANPGFAWLDGGAEGHRLAAEPIAQLAVRAGRATVSIGTEKTTFAARGFDLLEAALAAWGGAGGLLVGYLGYELGAEIEELPTPPPDDLSLPDLRLALFDRALLWDGKGWALESSNAWRDGDPTRDAEILLARAAAIEVPPLAKLATRNHVASRPTRDGFEAAVSRTVERIGRGEIFQANLCRRLEAPSSARDTWSCYRRLRAASPAIRGAFFDLGAGRALLSISPEIFLSVRGRSVETRPIKGTRPRGKNPHEDRALARELVESAKDRAELAMIVDVARNDLGRVAENGSITTPTLGELTTLPTVHHLVAVVRGTLRRDVGPADLLRATFPAASISGAPKIRAMAVISAEEERRRGPAMGAFGWISLNGDLELAVAIRTAAVAKGRIAYHAGCGITADSLPDLEREESEAKAAAFLTAVGGLEFD